MVDVGAKPVTDRRAVATSAVHLAGATLDLIDQASAISTHEMPCCPAKAPMAPDCDKCLYMALCLAKYLAGLPSSSAQPMVMALLHNHSPSGRVGEALGLLERWHVAAARVLPVGPVGAAGHHGSGPAHRHHAVLRTVDEQRRLAHEVEVVASLPCYSAGNVDAQRGDGVFAISEVGMVGAKQHYYKAGIGGWYHTREFVDHEGHMHALEAHLQQQFEHVHRRGDE